MRNAIAIHHRPTYRGSKWLPQEQFTVTFDTDPPIVNNYWDVAYSPYLDMYVAIGESASWQPTEPTIGYHILTSKDGRTWTPVATPSYYAEAGSLVWNAGDRVFCFLGYITDTSDAEYQSIVSSDGITWTFGQVNTDYFTPKGLAVHSTWVMGELLTKYIGVSPTGGQAVSTNGTSWTVSAFPGTETLHDIMYSEVLGKFVACGVNVLGQAAVYTSTDGGAWTYLFEPFFTGALTGIAENVEGSVLVAVSIDSILVYQHNGGSYIVDQLQPVGYGGIRVAWSKAMEAWLIIGAADSNWVSYQWAPLEWQRDNPGLPVEGGQLTGVRAVGPTGDLFLTTGVDDGSSGPPGLVVSK